MKAYFVLATDGAALKNYFKVFSSMKIFNFLQGLGGFGNFRFAEIKSCPSTMQIIQLLLSQAIKTFKQIKTTQCTNQ